MSTSKQLKQNRVSEAITRIKHLEKEMSYVMMDLHDKIRQLECLNEFSGFMNSSLDVREIRGKALNTVCKLLSCEAAVFFLIDPKTSELSSDQGVRLAMDDRSIAGRVGMMGESLIDNEVSSNANHRAWTQKMGFSIYSTVCVPLRGSEKTIGVLQAFNKLSSTSPQLQRSLKKRPEAGFHQNDVKLLEILANQVAAALENGRHFFATKKIFFETVEALAEAIEKKDRYTGGHTKRVVYFSMCIAKYLNLTEDQLERVRLGAILHDVGKIGIEDKILKKPASLDKDEWKVMQTHPELGFEIMNRVEGLKDVVGGVRFHHERWDGSGYPLKLKGEEIPLIARIISVADTYDAMVSTRPYRKGIEPKVAFDEIIKCRGSQFDPKVVDAFIKAFHHEKMGKGTGLLKNTESDDQLANCD